MSNGCIFSEAGSTFCGDQQFSLVLAIGTSRSKISADCRVSDLVQMLSTKGPPAIEGKPVPWDNVAKGKSPNQPTQLNRFKSQLLQCDL